MADMTNIDSDKITSAVSQMDNIVSGISGNVNKIRQAMQQLDKGWISPVKEDFMKQYRLDEAAMQEMLDQFQEMSAMLREAARDFDSAESEIASQIGSLR